MALKGFPARGLGASGNVDAAQVLANKNAIAANAASIAANAAKIAKMSRVPGDIVEAGEEVFVDSPKQTNWANYTAANITIPASPTAAKMRTAGFTLLAAQVTGVDAGEAWAAGKSYSANESFTVLIPATGTFKGSDDYTYSNNQLYQLVYPTAQTSGANFDVAEALKTKSFRTANAPAGIPGFQQWTAARGPLNFNTALPDEGPHTIWWNEKIDIVNAPLGLAFSDVGIIYRYGSAATEGFIYLTLAVAKSSMVGDWYRPIKAGVHGNWTRQQVEFWTFSNNNDQIASGDNVILGDGHSIKLVASEEGSAMRVAPATTWDKVGTITAKETGWTLTQAIPTSGNRQILLVPQTSTKKFFVINAIGSAQASEVTPQSVQQQPAAPIPSVTPVWQLTNADVAALITFNAANTITGVGFNYSDPSDDTKTSVFSLADMTTGFSPSGYYGGEARFIDVTMPGGKVVKVILVKKTATSLAIIVANPGANLSTFGKITNVQITAPAPIAVAPITRVGRSIPTQSGIDIVQQGTEATLGGLTFRVGGSTLATAKVQVRSADAAKSLTYHGWTARHGPPAGYNTQSAVNLAVDANTGVYVDIGTNALGVADSARWDVWTDTEAFMVRAYQRSGVIHLGVNKIN